MSGWDPGLQWTMKILHVSKFYPPVRGGIENFVRDLATAQAKQGHEVYVLAHQTDFAKPHHYENINGVALERVRTFGQLSYAPVTPEFPVRLWRAIRQFRPDIIHAHLPNVSAFWLLFCPKTCPLILHWHADVVASEIDRKLSVLYHFYKPWETALLKRADDVIATSRAYLDYSAPLRPYHQKCHVIPLGLDPDRMASHENSSMPDRTPDTKPPSPDFYLLVLSVGRFTYYKGFEYLVEAAEKTPRVRFIIVGDGPEYSAIKGLVAEKRLETRVFLPGSVDRQTLIRLFRTCDVFCLPSVERTEAFGLVLLEAMYFGKPLITTKIPGSGVMGVNIHGITGLQVPPQNPEALAEAIDYFREKLEKRLRMGIMAKKRLTDAFHIQSVVKKIEKLYRNQKTTP
ncbi:MAG: glycosyl transferase family 1 [Desulfobacterales bacterium CG23_combo_of_CG06-09_8_20_14_all_51_8]|nr:MAG: glycosyl transferase family 1 [Desulfobacterales bacterium CG23_combo_of_CG06-09_8_20_14_all_51_8]